MSLKFEWDDEKARMNLKKHDISFEEAQTVFDDPLLMTFPDPNHSEVEQRYLDIGISSRGRILVVVHTERESRIRIINCRKATARERRNYEETRF